MSLSAATHGARRYLLVKYAYRINLLEVYALLKSDSTYVQLLGYYLSVALNYRVRKPLAEFKKQLSRKLKRKSSVYLRVVDERKDPQSFIRIENKAANEWNVLTRDNLNLLRDRCLKWERSFKSNH